MFSRQMFSPLFVEFVSSLGFDGQTYTDSDEGACSVTLTVKNDGTWQVTSTGINALNVTGNWAQGAPIPDIGSAAYVRFTRTQNTGSCGSSSASTSWLSLSVNRSVTATAIASGSNCSRTAKYTVEFGRSDGGPVELSGTITLSAGAIWNPN